MDRTAEPKKVRKAIWRGARQSLSICIAIRFWSRMQIVKPITGLLLCCLLTFAGSAQNKKEETPKPAQSTAELQQQLEKILTDTHTPGVAVAIVHRDGPEWIAGLGKADVAAGRANSPETLFRIGSTSKAFASLSILKLANEGKLSLQDSVHKLAPEV
jgi:CubicO group peptidase (beta-lactamase class C family)